MKDATCHLKQNDWSTLWSDIKKGIIHKVKTMQTFMNLNARYKCMNE